MVGVCVKKTVVIGGLSIDWLSEPLLRERLKSTLREMSLSENSIFCSNLFCRGRK